MYLSKILKSIGISMKNYDDIEILDITRCYNKVEPNIIYASFDNSYIDKAIKNGARVIIGSDDYHDKRVIYIKVLNVGKTYAKIVDLFYHKYYKNTKFIGVTGTNGKTTVSTLIYSYFRRNNIKAILIGSNGIFYDDIKYKTPNTTPDIHVIAQAIKEASYPKYAVIEVSSIALDQYRVFNISFLYSILTNISEDHFDYHKNYDSYIRSKGLLFSNSKYAIINTESLYFDYFDSLNYHNLYYGLKGVWPSKYRVLNNKLEFELDGMVYTSNLLGLFNLYNIMAFYSLIIDLGYSKESIRVFLENFNNVEGRMNVFRYKNKTIIVDFAHTPYAIASVLSNIKNMHYSHIWSVCGAGGNRDKEKRELMGVELSKYSDYIILTNDNPRDEDEREIVEAIGRGISKNYKIILDRKKAILEAIMLSMDNDVIVILGKGNEDYIISKDNKLRYSDIDYVKNIIGE